MKANDHLGVQLWLTARSTALFRSVRSAALVIAWLLATSFVFSAQPIVTVQPTNQTALIGADIEFAVDFNGTPPVQCQWYKSGVAVASATNALLSLTNLSVASAGSYFARVSNAEGTNTSLRARLFIEMTNAVSTPITLTGWNRDVILENTAIPFAQSFDEATNPTVYGVWFEEGTGGNPNGLPSSRQFTSAINHPDVVFQFQPYDASNVLWMAASPASQRTNTLTLVSPKPYVSLAIAAASGYGDQSAVSTPSVSGYLVLNFEDGTKSAIISLLTLDWFVTTNPGGIPRAIVGLGSQYTTNSGASYVKSFSSDVVALCQTDINLLTLGYADKSLASITFVGAQSATYFTKTTTGIFAVSGVAADLGINPPVFLQSNVTNQNVAKSSSLMFSISNGGTEPVSYQWQLQASALGTKANIVGATNSWLLRTNIQSTGGYSIEARNAAGVATASAEINLYFGALTANGVSYNWGWNFFRQTTVRAQQSTNLTDWSNLGLYGNSFGFTASDNKQNAKKFFRIIPQ